MLTCPDKQIPHRRNFGELRLPWHRAAAVAALTLALAGTATSAHAATGETARFGASLGTIANPDDPATPDRLVPSGIAADQATGKVYVATRGADTGLAGPIFVYTEAGAPDGQLDLHLAPGIAQSIAVDGPRQRLLIATFDGSFGSGLEVKSVPTTNLAQAPTTVVAASTVENYFGNVALAVDQSTDATLGGRIFIGFSTSDTETIGDPADPSSGFVGEFSKAGAFVRKIGTPLLDSEAPPVAGKFPNGDIARLAVATDTHTLHAQSSGAVHTFATTGAASSLKGGVEEAFTVGVDGTLWYRGGADEVEPLLRLAPAAATPFSIPGAGGTTTPVPGQAPKACQLDAAAIGAAGSGSSAFFAASSADPSRTMVVRIGPGGQGCGLDPVLATATASDTTPEVGSAVQLTATGSSPESLGLSYEWDLDGSAATGAQGFETTTATGAGTVTPSKPGVLAIRVRLRDAQGSISAVRSLDLDVPAGTGGGGGVLPTPVATATPKPAVPTPTPAPPAQLPLAGATPTPVPAPPAPTAPKSLKGSAKKGVSVKLTCTVACSGKVELKSSKGVVLAKATYTRSKSGVVSVKLKLTKAGKKALAKSTKAKATLVITPSAGAATSTKVSLRLARA